jgi:O-acetyl-ADP-ribose deacetylase (regulator of RNase III)
VRDLVDMAELSLVCGDVTLQETDAIVNAANAGLAEGGGVCGACRIAVETLRDMPSSTDEIRLVAFDERAENALARLLPG